jgi:hypothetical protein
LYAVSIGVLSLAGNTPEIVAGVIYNPVSSLAVDKTHNAKRSNTRTIKILNINATDSWGNDSSSPGKRVLPKQSTHKSQE